MIRFIQWSHAVIATVFLLSSLTLAESNAQGLEGNTYTSPSFGFSVSWNEEEWQVQSRVKDGILLRNEKSDIGIVGDSPLYEDRDACLGAWLDEAIGVDRYIDHTPLVDDAGAELAGSTQTSTYAAYVVTLLFSGEEQERVLYIECRDLVEGHANLVIFHWCCTAQGELADYQDEVRARERLLDGLSLASPEEVERLAAPNVTPAADGGGTYVNPAFGYSLTWGGVWLIEDAQYLREQELDLYGVDFLDFPDLMLTDGDTAHAVFSTVEGDFQNAGECVAFHEELAKTLSVSNTPQVGDQEDAWSQEHLEGRTGSMFVITMEDRLGNRTTGAAYVECQPLDSAGAYLMILYWTLVATIDEEAERLNALLSGLVMPVTTGGSS